MPTLYLTEQGSCLRQEQGRLIVEKDGCRLFSAPALQVDRVLIFGMVQVTPHALSLLLSQGIETSFLSVQGRLKGHLIAPCSKNIALRLAQYERARDEEFALQMARTMVASKIRNARAVLARYVRNHPTPEIETLDGRLDRLAFEAGRKRAVASLLGVEGRAAAVYFQGMGHMMRAPGWEFCGRVRRPPRDPFNALLSLGYTLVGSELTAVTTAMGLDPHLGFLHGISYGRPSLSLDLLEEFRAPLVDRFTLSLVNLQIIGCDDFTTRPNGGLYLHEEPLKRYLREYEKYLNNAFKHPVTGQRTTFRRVFTLQAQALARAIQDKGDYCPYAFYKK
jgi:CRISPR-associated protein Cas1